MPSTKFLIVLFFATVSSVFCESKDMQGSLASSKGSHSIQTPSGDGGWTLKSKGMKKIWICMYCTKMHEYKPTRCESCFNTDFIVRYKAR